MTAADKKKAQVLVALLVIAGLTWFLVYRTAGTTTSAPNTAKAASGKAATPKQLKDPTILIGLIGSNDPGEDVGRKNIFQYRQKPLPPTPAQATNRPNPVPAVTNTPPPQVFTPSPPQPPPMKTFKYDGFSVPKPGKMLASLTDGTNSYQLSLGECLMGQYCVRQLSESSIEIEDIQLKQRRSFPRTPPQ